MSRNINPGVAAAVPSGKRASPSVVVKAVYIKKRGFCRKAPKALAQLALSPWGYKGLRAKIKGGGGLFLKKKKPPQKIFAGFGFSFKARFYADSGESVGAHFCTAKNALSIQLIHKSAFTCALARALPKSIFSIFCLLAVTLFRVGELVFFWWWITAQASDYLRLKLNPVFFPSFGSYPWPYASAGHSGSQHPRQSDAIHRVKSPAIFFALVEQSTGQTSTASVNLAANAVVVTTKGPWAELSLGRFISVFAYAQGDVAQSRVRTPWLRMLVHPQVWHCHRGQWSSTLSHPCP